MEDRRRAPGIVFVIIHGTASRGAWWTRPESKIRRRLARHFDKRGHSVSFEWSGANSNVARLAAGRALARRILELDEEFNAPIYLVAHSHGGNIALYAMRDPSVEEKVAGVICMGTLFIKCTQRGFVPAIEKAVELLPRLAGATVLGLIALVQFTGIAGRHAAILKMGWYLIACIAFLAMARNQWMPWYKRACELWINRLRGPIQSRSDSTITTLSLPRLPNLKLLCLSSPNDEATKCLRASIFVSELPFFAWRFLDKLAGWLMGAQAGLPGILTVAFYAGIAASVAGMFPRDRQIPLLHWITLLAAPRFAGLVILGIMPPFLLCYQLLLAAAPRLPAILTHGFRGPSPFDNWFTRITVEPAPEGQKDCLVKEINVACGKLNLCARNFRTFMAASAHTRLYNNRIVLREIIRWIYKTEETRPKPS
jgi:pimeloyl-ACP methyl ester carboxylesterase